MLWGHFCDNFIIDIAGKYSLIGVFDRIGAMSFPAVHRSMTVVYALTGVPHTSDSAVVTVWTPQDTILLSTAESPVQFSAEGRTLLVHLLFDVQFATAGTYNVVLEVGGRPAGSMELVLYNATVAQPQS
jgi:hypothetical protein